MPPPSRNAVRTLRSPVHLLPAEILSIIFLLIAGDWYGNDRVHCMLVCRRWYAIMLSTPGIISNLRIRKSTKVESIRAAIQGTKWLLNVEISMNYGNVGPDFNADGFDACFLAIMEAASRLKCLVINSLPRPAKCHELQIVPPLKNLRLFCLDSGCDLGSFFEPLMTAITTTTTSHLGRMGLGVLDAVLYLVQPDCLHVFCSLTTLNIHLPKRMEIPVNILPHLQRLEGFYAWHLHLPSYPPDAPLPLIQTLRNLSLKSVSVQWMAGRVFPVLQSCDITFPHQIDAISLQPVTMPACTTLRYDSNDLSPLRCFHHLPLAELMVKSGQWNVTRGNLQLVAICHISVPCAQSLTRLNLQVRCSGQRLIYMLSLLPALKVLDLILANPRALSETFFQAFVATKPNACSPCDMGALPNLPLCSKLVKLNVTYKRWLRDPEKTTLLLVFGDIASSRQSGQDFELKLGLAPFPHWVIWGHVQSMHEVADRGVLAIGFSSPHGIIPFVWNPFFLSQLMEVPFKDTEYLVSHHQLSIGCLSTLHHLVELRVRGEKDILPSEPPLNMPLFLTLKVLEAQNIDPSFLAGQTFHKLERCRIFIYREGPEASQGQVTQMPVCTRLDVDDLTLLSTLKLPQICELGASFYHPEFNMIWAKHIVVNTNLSGLELLHVYAWYQQADLIQALQCLPMLKSLILAYGSCLDAAFFAEFVRMHPNGTAGLTQTYGAGQASPILCPVLGSLLIEGCGSTEPVELIPVLEQVVTLRAVYGSPLERFTLSSIEFGRKVELIGSQGGFVVERDSLDDNTKPFRLII